MSTTAAAALAKKRVRRQKIFIAVGSVVLLAVLGYQLPKLLGGHGNQTVVHAPTTTPSSATASPALASSAAASSALPDTDRFAVQRDTSQLLSFGLFKSKDPFVQQLSASATPAPAAPAASPPPAAPKKTTTAKSVKTPVATATTPTAPIGPSVITQPAPQTSTTPVNSPTTVPATPLTPTPTAPPAAPTTALISTNGTCEQVAVKGTFPSTENIFQLVEIAKNGKSVKIAIAGGSYDSGQASATVKLGQKLTLVNTADGSRYVIVLEAKCAVIAPAATSAPAAAPAAAPASPSAPGAAASVVTPPAATPPTATTPIVTDPYDTTPPPSG
jgi:hypothetical protein